MEVTYVSSSGSNNRICPGRFRGLIGLVVAQVPPRTVGGGSVQDGAAPDLEEAMLIYRGKRIPPWFIAMTLAVVAGLFGVLCWID